MTILNIVIAREHARQELKNKTIEQKYRTVSTNILVENSAESTRGETQTNDKEGQEARMLIHQISNGTGSKLKLEKLPQPIGM